MMTMTAIAMTRDSVDDIAIAAVGSGTLEGYEQSRIERRTDQSLRGCCCCLTELRAERLQYQCVLYVVIGVST